MDRLNEWQIPLLLLLAASGHLLQAFPKFKVAFQKTPMECQAICYGTILFWMLHFYPTGTVSPFIYFQF